MAKDWNQRLTETIAFIKKTPVPGFSGDRSYVTEAVDDWNRTAPADQRKQLSELMSQEKALNRPSKGADRAYRRGRILVTCAVIDPDPTKWADTSNSINRNTAPPGAAYNITFKSAYDVVGSGAKAGPNLAFLLASPREFLEKYKISVSGRKESAPFEYGIAMDGGMYKISAGNPTRIKTNFRAINVPAVLYETVKGSLGSLTGTDSSEGDNQQCGVMLTTQFTGCTYCFMVSADRSRLMAAHIDPGGGAGRKSVYDGETVSKALRGGGGFRNGDFGVFRAYGRVSDKSLYGYPMDATQMIIVAIKGKNGWKVFAQISKTDGFSVERIDKATG